MKDPFADLCGVRARLSGVILTGKVGIVAMSAPCWVCFSGRQLFGYVLEANVYSHPLAFSKSLVTEILGYARSRGQVFTMTHGRNLVAQLLVEKNYSQAMAANNAGKLGPVSFDEQRQIRMCTKYPKEAEAINDLAALVRHFVFWSADRLTLMKTVTEALHLGRVASPPKATWDAVDELLECQKLNRADVEAVPAAAEFIHHGQHLSFVRRGQWWYLVNDFLFESAQGKSGCLSVVVDGMMLFGRDRIADHSAVTWVFENGRWDLRWTVHRIANDEDLDLTFDEFVNGG